MQLHRRLHWIVSLLLGFNLLLATSAPLTGAGGTTYYVSRSGGSDSHDGRSPETAFQTIAKVNALALQPGDRVLFKCGDVWRAEQLVLSRSGTAAAPITFGSYPEGCSNQPVLSGARPITGWSLHSANIYVATLPASQFPLGINQLFRAEERLPFGRWPNLDAGNGGYAFIDSHSSGSVQITDHALPARDWTGARVNLRNIRWSIIAREVTGTGGQTLTLNRGVSCLVSSWGTCAGWGYFLTNHLGTLDREGEWVYDAGTRKVYLYTTGGAPTQIEGSVVLEEAETLRHGGLMISDGSATAYVVVENLRLQRWFNHGIGSPGGMSGDIYHHITFRDLTIKDVDGAGVNLSSWLERPSNGRKGLRGGHDLHFSGNVIDGANHFGVSGYFAASSFEENEIRNIGLIENLNKSGMGCSLTWDQCTENGDGFRIRAYDVRDSGYGNTLRYNHFERIAYNGVDVFGPDTTLERNFITQACYVKADCGGVRTFGRDNLAATRVYNVRLLENIIVDIPGNVDGCEASRTAFGMGLYVDNYSRDVESRGNVIIDTTSTGINYQRSTGQIVNNTLHNAASNGESFSAHVSLRDAQVSLSGNIIYALNARAWTLYARALSDFSASNHNYLFHPYVSQQIAYGPGWTRYTFPGWQSFSGLEGQSRTNWFTQAAGEPTRSRAFYNPTRQPLTVSLGDRRYLDLDQNYVLGSIILAPFTAQVLVDDGPAPLTLSRIQPSWVVASEVEDFVLEVEGFGFTAESEVRWEGAPRPTTFHDAHRLTAQIAAGDVEEIGAYQVTVYDPAAVPPETAPLLLRVVTQLYRGYLPLVMRQ